MGLIAFNRVSGMLDVEVEAFEEVTDELKCKIVLLLVLLRLLLLEALAFALLSVSWLGSNLTPLGAIELLRSSLVVSESLLSRKLLLAVLILSSIKAFLFDEEWAVTFGSIGFS